MIILINELLFWSHLALLTMAVISGFFIPLPMIILLIILHRLHVWIFGGCLFSKLQQRIGGIPEGKSFLQVVTSRFFCLTISEQQSYWIDYGLVIATFILSTTHQLTKFI